MLPEAPEELPYSGAKAMLLVEDMENRELLTALLQPFPDNRECIPLLKTYKKLSINFSVSFLVQRVHF